jgi:hypothetical protein
VPAALPSIAPAAAAAAAPFGPQVIAAMTDAAASSAAPAEAALPPEIALQEQFTGLEAWAKANRRNSRWDAFRFWALKIPAIVVSAGSGVSAYFGLKGWAVIAGAVASLCVLIDALNPGGSLRNAHLRAFNELRILQEGMKSEWQVGLLRDEKKGLLAARIIEGAAKEKKRINDAITFAETSLGVTTRRGKH